MAPVVFVHRFAAIIVIPFLAVLGFLFACLRRVLATFMGLVGWDLAWPPVEVEEVADQSRKGRKRSGIVRNSKDSSSS